jgi:hypothetical protein
MIKDRCNAIERQKGKNERNEIVWMKAGVWKLRGD